MDKLKLLLIYPGVGVGGFGCTSGEGAWIHHGLGLIGSFVINKGFDVELMDMRNYPNRREFIKDLNTRQYDVVGITVSYDDYTITKRLVGVIRRLNPKAKIVVGGYAPSIMTERFVDWDIDHLIIGEGELAMLDIMQGKPKPRVIKGEKIPLDELPYINRSFYNYPKEMNCGFVPGQAIPMVTMISGRGCPHKCLQGDTIIETMELGPQKIKDLIGKDLKVLTRNPNTKEIEYAQAKNICKTQSSVQLVRVRFDDGTYIDCTPDHKFLTFINGNQFIDVREQETEAKDLKPKQSVRAIKQYVDSFGYAIIDYGRIQSFRKHRLVMEAVIERKLFLHECCHHKDFNKLNNLPSNLELTTVYSHSSFHPELSERMIINNPAKNLPKEHFIKLGKMQKGRVRTLESRIRYRESKLGINNPNYKVNPLRRRKYASRILEINHKVVSVEYLFGLEDVYCMEVPGYDWFFANNVLVHNCTFCQPAENFIYGKPYRTRSVVHVIGELIELREKYPFNSVLFWDDTFTIDKKWIYEFCDTYQANGFTQKIIACCRADIICNNLDMIKRLKEIGLMSFVIGIESGSQRMLDFLKKGTTVEQNKEAIRLCKEIGIDTFTTFMLGLPTETKEEQQATIDLIKYSAPTVYSLFYFKPIFGTEIYKYCVDNDLILHVDPLNIDRTQVFKPTIKGIDYEYLNHLRAELLIDVGMKQKIAQIIRRGK
jgi:radical SAM superfamily enzyme YgiQ (UPF0313 family)